MLSYIQCNVYHYIAVHFYEKHVSIISDILIFSRLNHIQNYEVIQRANSALPFFIFTSSV